MAEAFRLVILPATKPGLGRAGIRDHLARVHGPLVMAHGEVSGQFAGYVHHYVVGGDAMPGAAGADAVAIIDFADKAEMIASKASAAYRDHVGPDEDNFRDEAASRAYTATARVVRPAAADVAAKLLVFRRADDAEWAARLTMLGPQTGRIVINRLAALGPPPDSDFAFMDEIGLPDDADLPALEASLKSAVPAASVVLVTQPKVFVL